MNSRLLFPLALAAGLLTGLPDVFAAGSHADGHRHGFDFGRPAKASEAKRTVTVVMRDNLYEPEAIVVQAGERSEEHTSELQSLMRISYAVFCLKKKRNTKRSSIKK